jgi:hypothetical protein
MELAPRAKGEVNLTMRFYGPALTGKWNPAFLPGS